MNERTSPRDRNDYRKSETRDRGKEERGVDRDGQF